MKFLSHLATICLHSLGTVKLCFKIAAPFYVSTSNVRGFQFLYILSTLVIVSLFSYSHLVGVKCVNGYLIVVLICISLMNNDV